MPPRKRGTKAAPPDLVGELKKGPPKPVYAIDGDERVLVEEAVDALKAAAVPPHAADFNFDAFNAKDTPLARILDAAQTLPAFAERRMVLATRADAVDAASSPALLSYLDNPSPTTVLVLVADKLDARTKLYKALKKAGAAYRFDRPSPREMPKAVKGRAQRLGVRVEEAAVRALVDAVGTDLSAAGQALEVLALYVGPGTGRAVTADDVAAVVFVTKEENVFALVDDIGAGHRDAALQGLHGMLTVSRDHPLRVLAMIARHYRHLLKARSALDAGLTRADIQGLLGVPPFAVDGILRQARSRPASAFADGLAAIAATDRALKGGALEGTRAMERLVLGLMRR